MHYSMEQRVLRVGQVALGAFIGSLVLENLTRFAIWQLVPRVHDVQFALLITIISGLGGVLGAVSVAAFLSAKERRFQRAGWLSLVFGILGLALSLPQLLQAQQAFDENGQPFIDALAYVGLTSVWSTVLVIWGVSLLLKRKLSNFK